MKSGRYLPTVIHLSVGEEITLINDWSQGKQLILFPENLKGNKINWFPEGPVIK